MVRLALYQPDIPQNTGTLLRLGACLNISIDIIGPTGFDMSDKALRRAGMDYLQTTNVTRHISFAHFIDKYQGAAQRVILTTTKAKKNYTEFTFRTNDIILLGRESAGVPESVVKEVDESVTIPMQRDVRSLNIAVAGAMIIGEALRQTEGFPKPC